ncbi:MAG: hypothetical protein D6712_16765, partial [Chloroflexi bacterium]
MEIGVLLVMVCGLSLLCLLSLAVFAFFTGRGLLGPVIREFFGDGDIIEGDGGTRLPRRKRKLGDIKAQAQSLDFDDALRRHGGSTSFEAQGAPPAKPPTQPGTKQGGLRPGNAPKQGQLGEKPKRGLSSRKGSPFPPMKRRGGHTSEGGGTLRSGSGMRKNRDRERDQDELFD